MPFQKRPTSVASFAEKLAGKHRSERACNQVDGIGQAKAQEMNLFNFEAAFIGNQMKTSSYNELLASVIQQGEALLDAVTKSPSFNDLTINPAQFSELQWKELEQVIGKLDAPKLDWWKPFGIHQPGYAYDFARSPDLQFEATMRRSLLRDLLNLSMDQGEHPCVDDVQDEEDLQQNYKQLFTPIEFKRVQKRLATEQQEENRERETGVAGKGKKQKKTPVILSPEEEAEKAEALRLRREAAKNTGVGGAMNDIGSTLKTMAANATKKQDSKEAKKNTKEAKERLDVAWKALNKTGEINPQHEAIQAILLQSGCDEAGDLAHLNESSVRRLLGILNEVSASKLREALNVDAEGKQIERA